MKTTNLLLVLALLCPLFSIAQTNESKLNQEEKAIMDVIKEETRAYFERDFEAWKNTHVEADYYREHKYWEGWEDPVRVVRTWDENLELRKERFAPGQSPDKWDAASYIKTDLNIRISKSGDMAWVTFKEKAIDPKTKELHGRALGTRVMEKHDGQWKIAYLGYHYFPNEGL